MGTGRRLAALQDWLTNHFAITLLLSAAILAGGLALASRMNIEQDIGAMLPDGPGSPREAARLLEEFGVLNVLLIDLELPGASPEELSRAGNELATRFRSSGAFSEVLTGPTTEEILAVGRVLFPRRLYLLDDPASAIEARLSPPSLQASLTGLKNKLAAPQAIVTKDEVLRDPLGLNDELLAGLSEAASVQSHGGQLLSPDRTHLLLVTVPRASALDTDASAALLGWIEREGPKLPPGPKGPAKLRAAGGPRFAAESAATVKHDVAVTMLTSVAALLAIFLVRFRSLRLLVVAFVTLAFGVVGGLVAVALIHGPIHALTFAFGSVLIGIAIDYPIYLLNAASVQPGTPFQRMSAGLAESWRSLGATAPLGNPVVDARARIGEAAAAPRLGNRGVLDRPGRGLHSKTPVRWRAAPPRRSAAGDARRVRGDPETIRTAGHRLPGRRARSHRRGRSPPVRWGCPGSPPGAAARGRLARGQPELVPAFSPDPGGPALPPGFFFSSRRRHTSSLRDWSSDVCSSD